MAKYHTRILVHGAPVDTLLACPYDGLTNLTFPAYLNKFNVSGLVQPYGPIDDNGHISTPGIVRPNWPNPSGNGFHRPAPSGLERDYEYPWEFQGAFGEDDQRHFEEINWYQNYWACPSGHFFIFPSGVAADMPAGFQVGTTTNNVPSSFGNRE